MVKGIRKPCETRAKRPSAAQMRARAKALNDIMDSPVLGVDPPEVGSRGGFEDYSEALPFKIHDEAATPMFRPGPADDFDCEAMDWSQRACSMAETALREYYRLSFEVPVEYVGHAAARIAQSIQIDVCCLYDVAGGRLIFWNAEPKTDADYDKE